MGQTSYEILNSMPTTEFIAGTEFTLTFEMFEADGTTLLDITGGTVSVVISELGQPETAIITQAGVIDGTNTWYATLASADTESLSGVFVIQPVLVDVSGDNFRPAQGRLIILPANGI